MKYRSIRVPKVHYSDGKLSYNSCKDVIEQRKLQIARPFKISPIKDRENLKRFCTRNFANVEEFSLPEIYGNNSIWPSKTDINQCLNSWFSSENSEDEIREDDNSSDFLLKLEKMWSPNLNNLGIDWEARDTAYFGWTPTESFSH